MLQVQPERGALNRIVVSSVALLAVVYINSGILKSILGSVFSVDVDFTLIALILLAPISLLVARFEKVDGSRLLILYGLFFFFVIYYSSALYTMSQEYYVSKLGATLGLIFSLLFGYALAPQVRRKFQNYFIIFSIASAVIYYSAVNSGLSTEILTQIDGNSLVVGEITGAASVFLLFSRVKYKQIFILFLLILTLALGARGPFVFSALIIFFLYIYSFDRLDLANLSKAFGLVSAVYFVSVGVVAFDSDAPVWSVIGAGYDRLVLLFLDDKGDSFYSRTSMIEVTIGKILDSPVFGSGVGSFGIDVYGIDERAYPHNVPLEVFYESGILGFLSFLLVVLLVFLRFLQLKNFVFAFVFLYLFLNINKSSSLEELRFFFLLIGIAMQKGIAENSTLKSQCAS